MGTGSHGWPAEMLGFWCCSVGPWMAGISLSGPWESRLQAPHSSRLQPPFRCHLIPLGPSHASLLLLQPWAGVRWASPTRNFIWENEKSGQCFQDSLASSTLPNGPGVWNIPLGCEELQLGLANLPRASPEHSSWEEGLSADPGEVTGEALAPPPAWLHPGTASPGSRFPRGWPHRGRYSGGSWGFQGRARGNSPSDHGAVSRSLSSWSVVGFVNLCPCMPLPFLRFSLFLVVLLCTCLVGTSCFLGEIGV